MPIIPHLRYRRAKEEKSGTAQEIYLTSTAIWWFSFTANWNSFTDSVLCARRRLCYIQMITDNSWVYNELHGLNLYCY